MSVVYTCRKKSLSLIEQFESENYHKKEVTEWSYGNVIVRPFSEKIFVQYFKGLLYHTEAFFSFPTSKFFVALRSRSKGHNIIFFLQQLLLSCSLMSMFSMSCPHHTLKLPSVPVSGGSLLPDPPPPSTNTLAVLRQDVTSCPHPSPPSVLHHPGWRHPRRFVTPPTAGLVFFPGLKLEGEASSQVSILKRTNEAGRGCWRWIKRQVGEGQYKNQVWGEDKNTRLAYSKPLCHFLDIN